MSCGGAPSSSQTWCPPAGSPCLAQWSAQRQAWRWSRGSTDRNKRSSWTLWSRWPSCWSSETHLNLERTIQDCCPWVQACLDNVYLMSRTFLSPFPVFTSTSPCQASFLCEGSRADPPADGSTFQLINGKLLKYTWSPFQPKHSRNCGTRGTKLRNSLLCIPVCISTTSEETSRFSKLDRWRGLKKDSEIQNTTRKQQPKAIMLFFGFTAVWLWCLSCM